MCESDDAAIVGNRIRFGMEIFPAGNSERGRCRGLLISSRLYVQYKGEESRLIFIGPVFVRSGCYIVVFYCWLPTSRLESTTTRLERMRIPSFAMTFCLIGLMAGSLCAGSIDGQTLNQQEWEKVPAASTRRLLLPQLNRIYHPAPPEPVAPVQTYAPPYPPSPPAPKEYYYAPPYPPSPPVPKEYYAPPSPSAPKKDNALPGPLTTELNQDAYNSVNCDDRLCQGIRIGRRIFVVKLEN